METNFLKAYLMRGKEDPSCLTHINDSIPGTEMIVDQIKIALMVSDHPKQATKFKED
jgi:hypothetical protein